MGKMQDTQVTSMRIRERRSLHIPAQAPAAVDWPEPPRKKRGEALLKNLAVSAALVLCAVTLRTGAIPELNEAADIVLTAATDNSLLDEQLGKISFVSALFPEAVLVFGEQHPPIAAPVSAGMVVHAWSEAEPYTSWHTNEKQVIASVDGEVTGVYHGNGGERLVQVMGTDGLSCLYGNLATVAVQTGDAVSSGTVLGEIQPGADFVFEVRKDGRSVDPMLYLSR